MPGKGWFAVRMGNYGGAKGLRQKPPLTPWSHQRARRILLTVLESL